MSTGAIRSASIRARISWRRCLDMNDRALRSIVGSLGGVANGFPREDGFDITVASEVMAVFCLAKDMADLQTRLGKMIVAQTPRRQKHHRRRHQGRRRDVGAVAGRSGAELGADAGGLAGHGAWRAVRQHRARLQLRDGDQLALKLSDVVVTEAGFGADLGAEKFIDIKCRSAGLKPSCAVSSPPCAR